MEFIYVICVVAIGLLIWNIIANKNLIKSLKRELKEQWGKIPDVEYTSEKLKYLRTYYNAHHNPDTDIDDITWNDIDMNDLYMNMNNTQSAIGEEYLYSMIRKPCFSQEELKERNRIIEFFQRNEKDRIEVQLLLKHIGKVRNISIYEYLNRLSEQTPKSNVPHYLMILAFVGSFIYLLYQPTMGILVLLASIFLNIWQYYKQKQEIQHYLTVISYMLRLFGNVENIVKLDILEIDTYVQQLQNDIKIFQRFRRGAAIVVSSKVSGSIIDSIIDYIRMITHIDLIKYNKMLHVFLENRDALNRIYETIGYLDACIAAGSFRESIPYYSLPELNHDSTPNISTKDLYHPLIEDPVTNSIIESKSVLITGSNASGKSTFIKTLAINSLLSQTIYTSLSSEYKGCFFRIYSSMALRDSLFQNESYYIVEIKSLKRILDQAQGEIPILCFIDEVLRGTNTLERIAASSRILLSLAKQNVLCFAATHDIELTQILENYYSNYHFQEYIESNQIRFDYVLYPGRAQSKNAIKLLGMLGYSTDIIQKAEDAVEEFVSNGEWDKII